MTTEHISESTQNTAEQNSATPLVMQLPMTDDMVAELRAGQWLQLSGTLLLIGHRASVQLINLIEAGEPLPCDFSNTSIYLSTPGNAPLGRVIGSIAPEYTDDFYGLATHLFDLGARCLIGRGPLNEDVHARIKRKHGLYLITVSGAGSLLARCVYQSQIIGFSELGTAALRSIKVEKFPCMIAIDGFGRNILHLSNPLP